MKKRLVIKGKRICSFLGAQRRKRRWVVARGVPKRCLVTLLYPKKDRVRRSATQSRQEDENFSMEEKKKRRKYLDGDEI